MPYKTNKDLPTNVKELPTAAQDIYRAAFNAANEKGLAEDRCHAIAWSAVKRQYEKKDDKWVKKEAGTTGDSQPFSDTELTMFDAADFKTTRDGFLISSPRVARTGIQEYAGYEVGMPNLDKVSIYRPEDEVFSSDALQSLAYRPITLDHPPDMIDASNWKRYAVGQASGDIARDGECIRVPLVVMDATAINSVKAGKAQLSVGYTSDLRWGDGVTPDGKKFNATQTNIRANHIALVNRARGGPQLRMGDSESSTRPSKRRSKMAKTLVVDNMSVEFEDDRDAAFVERHIKQLGDSVASLTTAKSQQDAQIVTLTKQVSDKDVEIITLKKQIEDAKVTPQLLDTMVKDRQTVIDKARTMIGSGLIVDGRDTADIRKQVVLAKIGDAAKNWNDGQIEVSFTSLSAGVTGTSNTGAAGPGGYVDAVTAFSRPGFRSNVNDSDKAWEENNKRLTDAWKGGDQQQAKQ